MPACSTHPIAHNPPRQRKIKILLNRQQKERALKEQSKLVIIDDLACRCGTAHVVNGKENGRPHNFGVENYRCERVRCICITVLLAIGPSR